jgi:hypothetical protein
MVYKVSHLSISMLKNKTNNSKKVNSDKSKKIEIPIKNDGTKDKRYTNQQIIKSDGTRDMRTNLLINK